MDIRLRGHNVEEYTFPHTGTAPQWVYSIRDNNVLYNLQKKMSPENEKIHDVYTPGTPVPITDLEHDMAHERDFESEDLDFQPEDFKMQVPNLIFWFNLSKKLKNF